MKKAKFITMLLASAFVAGTLTGCGSFDATGYVSAVLDSAYKNDTDSYQEKGFGDENDVEDLYQDGIDEAVETLFENVAVSDEVKDEWPDVYEQMFDSASYEIIEAEKQSDGSFEVTVEYEQMKIFEAALDVLADNYEYSDYYDVENFYDSVYEELAEVIPDCLDDGVDYEKKKTVTIVVDKDDDGYSIKDKDIFALRDSFFDTEVLLKDVDASAIVEAFLDATFKNNSAALADLTAFSEEQAQGLFQGLIDGEVDAALDEGLSDELVNRYSAIFETIYGLADYSVLSDCEELEDGSYEVTVDCRKAEIFVPAVEKVCELARTGGLAGETEEERYESIYLALADSLEEVINNGYESEDGYSFDVIIANVGNKLIYLDTDSLSNIGQYLFDSDEM